MLSVWFLTSIKAWVVQNYTGHKFKREGTNDVQGKYEASQVHYEQNTMFSCPFGFLEQGDIKSAPYLFILQNERGPLLKKGNHILYPNAAHQQIKKNEECQ